MPQLYLLFALLICWSGTSGDQPQTRSAGDQAGQSEPSTPKFRVRISEILAEDKCVWFNDAELALEFAVIMK